MTEPFVCEYRGRTFTEGHMCGSPVIHYFENGQEWAMVYRDDDDRKEAIRILKLDIDHRDQ